MVSSQAGKPGKAGAAPPQQARQAATMALMTELRPLLRKYQARPAVAAPLACLPQHLHLELYALKQEEAELEQVTAWLLLGHDQQLALLGACTELA